MSCSCLLCDSVLMCCAAAFDYRKALEMAPGSEDLKRDLAFVEEKMAQK